MHEMSSISGRWFLIQVIAFTFCVCSYSLLNAIVNFHAVTIYIMNNKNKQISKQTNKIVLEGGHASTQRRLYSSRGQSSHMFRKTRVSDYRQTIT